MINHIRIDLSGSACTRGRDEIGEENRGEERRSEEEKEEEKE